MFKRFRRLRLNGSIRSLVRETRLSIDDIIYPLFITGGRDVKIGSDLMSGVYRMSIDRALSECQAILDCGIRSVMLFGVTDDKDSTGSESLNPDGLLASSVREIKSNFPALFLIADVCFCEYTDHGHCGLLDSATVVDNDGTLKLLQEQSLLLARSGADMVAPSAMMDGQVESIRSALDSNGFASVPIMSYSTKFASSYYGPFRDIALSRPSFGSRESYQMDCANRREAILESLHDEIQGADILMVKPALAYLDVVREIRDRTLLPLALYNVSGEYALLKAGQKLGVIDYERMLMENMISFKRAGADLIITYHAKEVAQILSR